MKQQWEQWQTDRGLKDLNFLMYQKLIGRPVRDPACRHCGYCVYGLTKPRCPECGADLLTVGVIDPAKTKTLRATLFKANLWTLLILLTFIPAGIWGLQYLTPKYSIFPENMVGCHLLSQHKSQYGDNVQLGYITIQPHVEPYRVWPYPETPAPVTTHVTIEAKQTDMTLTLEIQKMEYHGVLVDSMQLAGYNSKPVSGSITGIETIEQWFSLVGIDNQDMGIAWSLSKILQIITAITDSNHRILDEVMLIYGNMIQGMGTIEHHPNSGGLAFHAQRTGSARIEPVAWVKPSFWSACFAIWVLGILVIIKNKGQDHAIKTLPVDINSTLPRSNDHG